MLREILKGVARNTSVMLVQQIITWSSTFVLLLYLPRYLGPVEYGRLFLAISISGIFLIFVNYGGNPVLVKQVSRSRDDTAQLFVDAMWLRLLFWLASLVGIIVFCSLSDYPREVVVMLLIAAIGLLFDTATTCLYACYQGNEQMRYTSVGVIAKRLFISLVGVTALLMGTNAIGIAIILVSGSLVNAAVLAAFARNIFKRLPEIRWAEAPKQLKEGLPYFLLIAFGTIYYRIDSILLSKMCPEVVVGWYGAAYRLFDSFNFFPYLITVALYPVLSRLWKSEEATHRRTVQKSLEYIVITGVPLTVGVIVFSPNLVRLLFGLQSFEQSIIVLQSLAVGLLFLFVDMVLAMTLLSSDKQRQQSIVALSAIPVNIGLNYVLIPHFQRQLGNGGVGAAITTVVTELYVMIALFSLLPKDLFKGFRSSVLAKSAGAGLCMTGSIVFLNAMNVPWLLQALLSSFLYVVVLFAMRTFELQEREFFVSLLKVRSIQKLRDHFIEDNTERNSH